MYGVPYLAHREAWLCWDPVTIVTLVPISRGTTRPFTRRSLYNGEDDSGIHSRPANIGWNVRVR